MLKINRNNTNLRFWATTTMIFSVATVVVAIVSLIRDWNAGASVVMMVWAVIFNIIYQNKKNRVLNSKAQPQKLEKRNNRHHKKKR